MGIPARPLDVGSAFLLVRRSGWAERSCYENTAYEEPAQQYWHHSSRTDSGGGCLRYYGARATEPLPFGDREESGDEPGPTDLLFSGERRHSAGSLRSAALAHVPADGHPGGRRLRDGKRLGLDRAFAGADH